MSSSETTSAEATAASTSDPAPVRSARPGAVALILLITALGVLVIVGKAFTTSNTEFSVDRELVEYSHHLEE